MLAIENFEGTGLGLVGEALLEAGAVIDHRLMHAGDALPASPDGFDALVVLGGAQNALADDECPWLPPLCALMRAFGDSDRAVLGICLGSQLLARAYAAENLIGGATEFGWLDVELTEEGVADPVLGGAGRRFPVFHWHDDTFILPRGAVRLAGSLVTHNQAFRVRRAAYGIQFHFEADRGLVEEWSTTFADWLATHRPGWGERRDTEAALHGPAADAAGLAIARAWVGLIR